MMIQQHHDKSLTELKQFLQQISTQSDPYWQTILQSDIRNIIPKHEVCKIELIKNNLSKTRLIMENLNTFISLEVQKKHLKDQMIDLNSNIVCELEQIQKEQKKPTIPNHYHYDTNLNKKKKQFEIIAKELSKSRTSSQLKILIEKNKKWQQYIQKHLKELQKAKEQDLHQDMTNFLTTYQNLFIVDVNYQHDRKSTIHLPCKETIEKIILQSGSYTKLYENKVNEKILISKLLDNIYGPESQTQVSDQDDYWKQEIDNIRKLNDI